MRGAIGRIVDEQQEPGRQIADPGCVVHLQRSCTDHRRSPLFKRIGQHPVQERRTDTDTGLFQNHCRRIQQAAQVAVFFGTDKHHRSIIHPRQGFPEGLFQFLDLMFIPLKVEFIADQNAGFPGVLNHGGNAFILCRHPIRAGFQHQQHKVCPADGVFRTHPAEKFHHGIHFALPADPGGIHQHCRTGFPLKFKEEMDIHCITGGSGHIADDHPFFPQQGVDQRGFPHIGAPRYGDAEGFFLFGFAIFGDRSFRQSAQQGIQQVFQPAVVHAGDGVNMLKAQFGKFSRSRHPGIIIALIDCQQHLFSGGPQSLGHFLIQLVQTFADAGHKDQYIRTFNGRRRLFGNDLVPPVSGTLFAVQHAQTAGVDQLKMAAQIRGRGHHPVTGDAAFLMDNGDPPLEDAVEE